MSCSDFVELVTAFLDAALDAETERRVVDHLPACDGCERYLEQFLQAVDVLGDLPAETLPDKVRHALLTALRN